MEIAPRFSARRRDLGLLPLPLAGEGWGGGEIAHGSLVACPLPIPPPQAGEGTQEPHESCRGACRAKRANPTAPRALLWPGTNGAPTHVEGAHAACGGAGGVRGLERRRPPPPSRLLRRLRRAQPIQLRRVAARPRDPT